MKIFIRKMEGHELHSMSTLESVTEPKKSAKNVFDIRKYENTVFHRTRFHFRLVFYYYDGEYYRVSFKKYDDYDNFLYMVRSGINYLDALDMIKL